MMPINKCLKIFFSVSMVLVVHGFIYGQTGDSLSVAHDTTKISFAKVVLDGKVSFQILR